jgi:hypothetical protein
MAAVLLGADQRAAPDWLLTFGLQRRMSAPAENGLSKGAAPE